jgi:endonuclease YncB( thermonuclease family)
LNKIFGIKEYGQDRYGRTLGVVSQGGKNVNLEMVESGYAKLYRIGIILGKIRECSLFRSLRESKSS